MQHFGRKPKKIANHVGISTLRAENGKPVASAMTDANGVLYLSKSVDGSRHFLRTPPGIAFDKTVIAQAERLGCRYVLVTDRETGEQYETDLLTFLTKGLAIARGFGPQIALPFPYWHSPGDVTPDLFALEVAA